MSNTEAKYTNGIIEVVRENQGVIHPFITIKPSPVGGLGVFSTQAITLQQGIPLVLLRIPKTSIFSYRNSSIANLLADEGVDGVLAMILAFSYERRNANSPWYNYLQSIQYRDSKGNLELPPSFWDDKLKAHLKGTMIDNFGGLTKEEGMLEAFHLAIELAERWNSELHMEIPEVFDIDNKDDKEEMAEHLAEFVAIAFALSSRVFDVDAYHENALVPIADIFNHNSKGADVRFESTFEVCPECGWLDGCNCAEKEDEDEEDDEEEEEEEEEEDEEEEDEEDEEEDDDEMLDVEIDKNLYVVETTEIKQADNKVIHADDCVDIVLFNDIPADTEIFNSYGEYPNPILLSRYGFIDTENPNDELTIENELVKYINSNKKKVATRATWWKETGYEIFAEWYAQKRQEHDECPGDAEKCDKPEGECCMKGEAEDKDSCCKTEDSCGKDEDNCGEKTEEAKGCADSGCQDGCCGGLRPWMVELYITKDGSPSLFLNSFLRLLTLHDGEFQRLTEGETKIDILDTKNGRTWDTLLEIIKLRKSKTQPYKGTAKPRELFVNQLIALENDILEKCTKLCKNHGKVM